MFHRLPVAWNVDDADKLVRLLPLDTSDEEKNRARLLSYTCQGSLIGLTSKTGALVAHEVVKCVTCQFTPIYQWMIDDAAELMMNGAEICQPVNSAEFLPRGDRFDSLQVCMGEQFCSKLRSQRILLGGVGAIGCEVSRHHDDVTN